MRLRRQPKPKVVPRVVVHAEWTIRDPARDAREAAVEVAAWAARWAVPLGWWRP